MANPEHLAKLKEGREAWSSWRKANPRVPPDLSGVDFTSSDEFSGSSVWGRPSFSKTGRERALLGGFDFARTSFVGARLDSVDLTKADLSRSDLTRANLSRAELQGANLSGATLTSSRWAGALIAEITYERRLLTGRCYGVGGMQESFGDAQFRRDVQDQDYIDTRYRRLGYEYPRVEWCPPPVRYVLAPILALLNGIKSPLIILGAAVAALIVALVVDPSLVNKWHLLWQSNIPWQSALIANAVCARAILTGLLMGLVVGSWWGKRLALIVWSTFDYGRDWARVVIFASFAVGAIGFAYSAFNGSDLILEHWLPTCTNPAQCVDHPFYPWYVAAMGFCTLGVSDLVVPKSGLGLIIVIANVISGFATLGLLLAVLADGFARRA